MSELHELLTVAKNMAVKHGSNSRRDCLTSCRIERASAHIPCEPVSLFHVLLICEWQEHDLIKSLAWDLATASPFGTFFGFFMMKNVSGHLVALLNSLASFVHLAFYWLRLVSAMAS